MLTYLNRFRELSPESLVLRLVLAMLIGGYLGLERERKKRPAGFRTYMLVCMGATLTMMLSQYEYINLSTLWRSIADKFHLSIDVSRFGSHVVNGVGFLGAGTIIINARQEVKGLTTAAGLWAAACMGLALGAGFYECALLGFLLIFCSTRFLEILEVRIIQNAANINVYVEFHEVTDIRKILLTLKKLNVHVYSVELDHGHKKKGQPPNAVICMRLTHREPHARLLSEIAELSCVSLIDEV